MPFTKKTKARNSNVKRKLIKGLPDRASNARRPGASRTPIFILPNELLNAILLLLPLCPLLHLGATCKTLRAKVYDSVEAWRIVILPAATALVTDLVVARTLRPLTPLARAAVRSVYLDRAAVTTESVKTLLELLPLLRLLSLRGVTKPLDLDLLCSRLQLYRAGSFPSLQHLLFRPVVAPRNSSALLRVLARLRMALTQLTGRFIGSGPDDMRMDLYACCRCHIRLADCEDGCDVCGDVTRYCGECREEYACADCGTRVYCRGCRTDNTTVLSRRVCSTCLWEGTALRLCRPCRKERACVVCAAYHCPAHRASRAWCDLIRTCVKCGYGACRDHGMGVRRCGVWACEDCVGEAVVRCIGCKREVACAEIIKTRGRSDDEKEADEGCGKCGGFACDACVGKIKEGQIACLWCLGEMREERIDSKETSSDSGEGEEDESDFD